MPVKFLFFALGAVILAAVKLAHAQPTKNEPIIGVVGAPDEPRFSEIVAGLKKGLGELGYSLKTAKQIGLTVPPNVLVRADKVIR